VRKPQSMENPATLILFGPGVKVVTRTKERNGSSGNSMIRESITDMRLWEELNPSYRVSGEQQLIKGN
jgi:hypothetical protein